MLPKTRRPLPSKRLTAWRCFAALAGSAVLAWSSTASAQQDAGRAVLPTPVSPLPPDSVSAEIAGTDPYQIGEWQQEYSCRVNHVLNGQDCRPPRVSFSQWWHSLSQRLVENYDSVRPERLKGAVQTFVADHTLPPEHEFDVDVYDQRPIAVASTVTVESTPQTDAQREVDVDSVSDKPGTSRLKTDVRKIRPTLSYAMRNIDSDQLPEGFHEKLDQGDYVARQASPAVLQWAPTNLYHYPLYFEDPALERYGHTYHPVVQPFASAGRFATQLVGLPYQMTLHPVKSKEYALGYYRPGECAPKKHYQIPFNEEATAMQAAAVIGFFLIFP